MRSTLAAAAAVAALAAPAAAEVVEAAPNGFQVKGTVEIAAPRERVWEALIEPGRWWSSSHSWSGDAANLTLEPQAGGCFCERWAGGEAMHMSVSFVQPDAALHLWGALGPLSREGAAGGLLFKLEPKGDGTALTWSYTVGGFAKGGLAKWAPLVDGVLREQVGRLEALIETGTPK